ncbi:MAG: hypothetical protein R3E32_24540 [Chitinophagales bacterium]
MKQLFIFFAFCMMAFLPNYLAAQDKNDKPLDAKKDTIKYLGILGSQTHSGSECGHNRASTGKKPHFRILIVDLDITKIPAEEVEAMSFQSSIKAEITAPYKKTHTFKFDKKGKGKISPDWEIEVPCYAQAANFTIELTYKDKKSGKIKPLKINGESNQLKLLVDFTKEKVYAPDQSKTFLGSFNKKLNALGDKNSTALKVMVE